MPTHFRRQCRPAYCKCSLPDRAPIDTNANFRRVKLIQFSRISFEIVQSARARTSPLSLPDAARTGKQCSSRQSVRRSPSPTGAAARCTDGCPPSKLVFMPVVDVHFESFRTVVVGASVFFVACYLWVKCCLNVYKYMKWAPNSPIPTPFPPPSSPKSGERGEKGA